ncbi:TonB-dependent receptor domain-containing protein [Hymenobacter elongatus]|uniref:TonB-dependent receptor n=1 Tax=Hymenobacter elongatus TaxID=877208 RepID=A0A4Z0PQ35_9BACT|nr:TonB-dependent receptor [Hymenobacter elongatus]TGE17828.1 TonB-dependent receptor [Hymenobacter elongatus]
MRRSGLLFILLIISTFARAQQGTLSGKVTDKKTGEGVIGATVLVTGTVQAAPVDVDGKYELKLEPGSYNITMTYIGYKPMTFAGIVVSANANTTLNGVMEENTQNLKEVVVTGQKQTGTEVALIQDLRKSEMVVSGMSNDQIVKTLDRDASEVVKRIPGVTIQNNNFIVIRGLAERYNTVMLNDALTPSAEVDTRSFSFDILPSSVIDRILIFKSGSPELPGEFGGGVVKVYTKNSVLENTTSFSLSGWARNNTTFQNGYMSSNRTRTDWLGFDNGRRDLPAAVPAGQVSPDNVPAAQLNTISRSFRSTAWLPSLAKAMPDLRASLGINRRFEIGSMYLSNVTSVSYSNTREQYVQSRQRAGEFVEIDQKYPLQYDYNDTRALTAVRLGVIHNWQLRLNDRNRVEFRNFLNQYGTDEVVNRVGVDKVEQQERNDHALHYQSRTIYSGQLQGTHEVGPASRSTVTWTGGYNYVYRDEPDYSRYRAQRPEDSDRQFFVVIPNGGNPFDASRFFSSLKENTYTGAGQWEQRLLGRDTTKANEYKIRAGFYTERKTRQYNQRYFSYTFSNFDAFNNRPDRDEILTSPIDRIFAPENIDPVDGFKLEEGTKPDESYEAENTLLAGYVGVVAPISDQLSLSGGLRVEHNRRFLDDGGEDPKYQELKTIPLPSLNATYNFNQRSLLRLGGSVSVNRPEFREIAGFSYFDFSNNAIITGNDSLQTATIYNADLRYEFYPTRSEMLSIGVFYKQFRNAIEQTTQSVGTSQLYLTYQNADKAYDVGIELEARKGFVELTENPFLQKFGVVLNASFIRSRVQLPDNDANRGFALTDRALQGQSPFVVNTGVFFQDDDRKWQVSAQYNVIGQRISFVGDKTQNFSAIEMPRHVVDLAVTKGLGKHLQLKAGIQDLLNQRYRTYYDLNRDGKISKDEPRVSFVSYRRGTYSTLGLTYNF